MATSRIRYISVVANDPAQLAEWYAGLFGTTVLGQSAAGDISITDGSYNMTFFKRRTDDKELSQPGLHHIGLEVDSVAALERDLAAWSSEARLEQEPRDVHHGQARLADPNGYQVSVSETSFGVPQEARRIPGIRHVAWAIPKTNDVIDFYSRVFGLRELPTSFKRRQANLGNRFGGDGFTNLALHPHPPEPGREAGRHQRVGLNHFGFLVPDCEAVLDALDINPKDSERPANRPYAEYRIFDPEGNAVDISQFKGWEVDTGKWERATEPA